MSTARLGWRGLTRGRYTPTGSGALMKGGLSGDFDLGNDDESDSVRRVRCGKCRVRCSMAFVRPLAGGDGPKYLYPLSPFPPFFSGSLKISDA